MSYVFCDVRPWKFYCHGKNLIQSQNVRSSIEYSVIIIKILTEYYFNLLKVWGTGESIKVNAQHSHLDLCWIKKSLMSILVQR